MKPITFFSLACICYPAFTGAQGKAPPGSTSTVIHCTDFFVSKPLRDLPAYKPTPGKKEEAADKRRRIYHPKSSNFHPSNDYSDPLRQTSQGIRTGTHAPLENFEGIDLYEYDPPDPNGAVDSDYYVSTVNVMYAVFDKTGNTILSARDLGALWSGDPQDGDPVVLYDKFADRWVITEFQVTNTPYQFCVAVSETNDPTGSFYVWKFSMGNTFPDYPKYAIWDDGYYITYQAFGAVNPLVPQQVAVLERNRMLEGSPSAAMIIANLPSPPDFMGGNNSLFSAPKVLDCDASALPPYGTPDYLVYFENIASGGYSNSIVMYQLTTDTALHTLTVSRADSFAVPTFNAYFSDGNETDISQPGDANGVDALDGTFNFRVPYMRFTGYNSVVMSNTVNLGSSVAGIRWYELRQNDTTGVWSLYQDGTYGPNDGVSRWNGSICQDYDGNIALQYCVASSSVYPGIRYTGRLSTDALGQMTFAEVIAKAGTYSLSNVGNRWGDYSELDIDPSDGLTFWGNNEYGGIPTMPRRTTGYSHLSWRVIQPELMK